MTLPRVGSRPVDSVETDIPTPGLGEAWLPIRSRTSRAGGELRHMACSQLQAALRGHSEDDAMTPTRRRFGIRYDRLPDSE